MNRLLLAALIALFLPLAQADAGHWQATWSASPQRTWGNEVPLPLGVPTQIGNQTLRQTVKVSLGGQRVRIALSNAYGSQPVAIGGAAVALAAPAGRLGGPSHRLTFAGQPTAYIAPGAELLSDPLDLAVPALGELAVSIYLPQPTAIETFHWDGKQRVHGGPGEQLDAALLPVEGTMEARLFLADVLVENPEPRPVVAVLGDSITDGRGASLDGNQRWPDLLAQRLASRGVGVINAGISGGRLLSDGMGQSALVRFQRDALGEPGVRAAIVLLGINDISWPGSTFAPNNPLVQYQDLVAGYRQLIAQAHVRGVRIVGATILPFERALSGSPIENYHADNKEALRQRVNQWIRQSGEFDAVVDLDARLRDPRHPLRLLPAYDSGDYLHPGDAGNRAMAESVDIEALLKGM
ncbi:SGNH/GDSL hydrolase family protein [Pseudomonas sp. GD04087]|uniref:SGNH/GDSL hydrolase family protein n=1 Tax=unclassified Pseudomonas TaxID=196821 RepID=UPI00244C55D5|nr:MULTISPECIES: SGNH/GDSL hydrolase family protein [unclassified Pseudomonas]MDH0291730.1 SGNH/GDSL hydrolase family protein [Pseudomonas sp. GD04087]MDH1051091.1 SGNH/GDSL hydrolase family protein [Pseudomonas sp. GD03903]MDH1998525.1 SGNH/GDSL hydrolase family protein [Pseudomonas sp. GD03691]